MTIRRLVVAAAITLTALISSAPTASAGYVVCAWSDPYGVCLSNPIPPTPSLPRL